MSTPQTPSKFNSVIAKVTPWLATAASLVVPGAGPIISLAAGALTKGLGSPVKADSQSISDAISTAMANPDQLATLKKIDDDFAVQMRQLGFQELEDVLKIQADDVANARAREVALRDWYPKVLASAVVISCLFGEFAYFHWGAPANAAPELIGRILGTLDNALILVLGYYFGSSVGSDRKTELLAQNGNGGSK